MSIYDWDERTSALSRELIGSVPIQKLTASELQAFKAGITKLHDLEEKEVPAEQLGTCSAKYGDSPHTKSPDCVRWQPAAQPKESYVLNTDVYDENDHFVRDVADRASAELEAQLVKLMNGRYTNEARAEDIGTFIRTRERSLLEKAGGAGA